MEIVVKENSKNKFLFELKDVTHTFCNLLKTELWNDKHVKVATYSIDHPLVGMPRFIVETDGKETPQEALQDAVKRLKKINEKVRKDFSKELK